MKIIGSKGSVEMTLEMMQRSFEGYLDPCSPSTRIKFELKPPTSESADTWKKICTLVRRELKWGNKVFPSHDLMFAIAYDPDQDMIWFCEVRLVTLHIEAAATFTNFKLKFEDGEKDEFQTWVQKICSNTESYEQEFLEEFLRDDGTVRFGKYKSPGMWIYGGYVQPGRESEFVNFYLESLPEEQREAVKQAILAKNVMTIRAVTGQQEDFPC